LYGIGSLKTKGEQVAKLKGKGKKIEVDDVVSGMEKKNK